MTLVPSQDRGVTLLGVLFLLIGAVRLALTVFFAATQQPDRVIGELLGALVWLALGIAILLPPRLKHASTQKWTAALGLVISIALIVVNLGYDVLT
jgi:Ca2+/Na+ antiporter